MKQIKDYPNYFITEFGEIYHKRKSGLRQVKLTIDKYGYFNIGLYNEGVRTFYKTHRLVAKTYIPNSDNLPQVNHIDGNKLNNHISNLEWVTNSENQKHAYKTGLKKSGEQHHKSKLTNEQIKWIRDHYIYKHDEFGSTSLGKKFNVCHGTILRIIKNQRYAEK